MAKRRILIVEDDADVREALAEALSEDGTEVVVAVDGIDALARLHEGLRPSVILLDLRLPRLGGEGFLRELRADPLFEHVPVITMTGGCGAGDGHRGPPAEADRRGRPPRDRDVALRDRGVARPARGATAWAGAPQP
jgi:CheY-like chemotaxis protein